LTIRLDPETRNNFAVGFSDIASRAGKVIMDVYASTIKVTTKPDGSPVSEADTAAEGVIRAGLEKLLPGVLIVAEESFGAKACLQLPDLFILVDPLDGTREFISRNGEFTVNIALIENASPVAGCVYAPAINCMYLGGANAFRADVRPGEPLPPRNRLAPLLTQSYPAAGLRALISRSHLDGRTQALLDRLPVASRVQAGSALKFGLMAQGDADVYPRCSPTMEWDVAAGHAVLAAAGGCVLAADGKPLRYGKVEAGLRNDGFMAWGGEPLAL
jgi:3'(2'), 5'-bisphosphate nucleotidase